MGFFDSILLGISICLVIKGLIEMHEDGYF